MMNIPIAPPSLDMQWNRNSFLNRSSSFGIPVDNVSLNEAVEAIFSFIERYEIDRIPKLVSTLNVDFLVNCLGYNFDKPRHPELLSILRGADLVTADGFPIVLFSKIAGCGLKARVTGADLAPALAHTAAARGKSIYFLGGAGDSAQQAADKLANENPGLKVAGASAPMVATEGKNLSNWRENDAEIVDEINASGADILLIGLGNPKQELWFSRNKYRLKVPVSIGVGGTFAFITGQVKRAPQFLQANNLEWLYRIYQEPRRLFKRYALGGIKFAMLSLPIIRQRFRQDILGACQHQTEAKETPINWCMHWSSRRDVLMTLRLPHTLNRNFMENLALSLREQMHDKQVARTYIIDFSNVEIISLAASQAFAEVSSVIDKIGGIYIGMKPKVRKQLAKSRVLDFAANSDASMLQMQHRINSAGSSNAFTCKTYAVSLVSFTYLSGEVSGEKLLNMAFTEALSGGGKDRSCVIDLRQTTSIDTAAIGEFLGVVNAAKQGCIKQVFFSGLTETLLQAFKVAGVTELFQIIDDSTFSSLLFPASE